MRTLVAIVCVCLLLAFVHVASSIVIPFLLALALATAFQPIARRIARRGWPPLIAAILSTAMILVFVGGAGFVLYLAASDLAASAPDYAVRLGELQTQLATWLDHRELHDAARSVREFELEAPLMAMAQSSVLELGSHLQTMFFVLVITAFIQLEARQYRRKLIKAFEGPAPLRGVMAGLREVQRYMLVKLVLSGLNGIFLGLWCWVWGVDSPLLWGVVAFALNFIPVLGSVLAALPPIAIAMLTDGFGVAAGVAAGYVVVNLVVDNVVEPRIMGHTLGLSPLVVVLSMLVWGFVLGPVGAILAVPLTMTVKIMFEHDEDLRRIAMIMGDGSDLASKPAP